MKVLRGYRIKGLIHIKDLLNLIKKEKYDAITIDALYYILHLIESQNRGE